MPSQYTRKPPPCQTMSTTTQKSTTFTEIVCVMRMLMDDILVTRNQVALTRRTCISLINTMLVIFNTKRGFDT